MTTPPRRGIHLSLPLSLAALLAWLLLTISGRWLGDGGAPASLTAAVAGGIGLPWLLAAAFSVALALALRERAALGLNLPQPLKTTWLAWPPLLYSLLMLLVAWAGGWPPRPVLLIVACNTVLVAVSEELMFRAILLQGLLDRWAQWPAVLACSALFGLAHTVNGLATGDVGGALWQAVAAFLQGICYAAIRLRTRSIWPMVVVHALWDFALVTATLSAAAEGEGSVLPFAALLAVLPLCLYGVFLLRNRNRNG